MYAPSVTHATRRKLLSTPLLAGLSGILGGVSVVSASALASPLVGAALLLGVLVAAAVMVYPTLGFLMTALVVPVERIGRFTPDSSIYTISLMRIMGTLALGSFLLHALLNKWKLRFGPAFFVYSGYLAVAALGITHTTDYLGTVRAVPSILGNLLFFFLVINVVRDWKVARKAVLIWLAATVLIGMFTIYEWHFGQRMSEADLANTTLRFSTVFEDKSEFESIESVARAVGPTSHAAVYGINLILTLPFFFYLWRTHGQRWVKAMLVAGVLVVVYNILLTNTRAAIILMGVVFVIIGMRKLFSVTPAKLIAAMLLGTMLLPFVPQSIFERVLNVSNYTYERSNTLRIRLEYWSAGLTIISENWLTGIGVGNQKTVPKYINDVAPDETTVHNEYLMTMMEVGIFGWLLHFGFVAMVLRASYKAAAIFRRYRETREQYWFMVACQIAMLSVLIFGVQVDVFHFPLKGWWMIAGLSWVMYLMAKQLERQGKNEFRS